jgi:septal ring factor EnvC (AmiA/AmiB activator)
MKRFIYPTLGIAIFAAAICLHAPAQSSKDTNAAATQQSVAEQQERIQRYNQLVQGQEDRARRVESLLIRQEQLMDKQEAAFARFEKILATWEQQQKQYQKYLDSLPKR